MLNRYTTLQDRVKKLPEQIKNSFAECKPGGQDGPLYRTANDWARDNNTENENTENENTQDDNTQIQGFFLNSTKVAGLSMEAKPEQNIEIIKTSIKNNLPNIPSSIQEFYANYCNQSGFANLSSHTTIAHIIDTCPKMTSTKVGRHIIENADGTVTFIEQIELECEPLDFYTLNKKNTNQIQRVVIETEYQTKLDDQMNIQHHLVSDKIFEFQEEGAERVFRDEDSQAVYVCKPAEYQIKLAELKKGISDRINQEIIKRNQNYISACVGLNSLLSDPEIAQPSKDAARQVLTAIEDAKNNQFIRSDKLPLLTNCLNGVSKLLKETDPVKRKTEYETLKTLTEDQIKKVINY